MSDYISKSELLNEFDPNGEPLDPILVRSKIVHCTTLSETEIIRKAFERVVERLEERKDHIMKEFVLADKAQEVKSESLNRINELDGAIEIVKEECGISE